MGSENRVAEPQLAEVEDENMIMHKEKENGHQLNRVFSVLNQMTKRFDLNPKSPELELLSLNMTAKVVCEEDGDYNEKIKALQGYLDMVKKIGKPGCSEQVLKAVLSSLSSLVNTLSSMSSA